MSNNWLKPEWPAPTTIKAATTLRFGGVSIGAFNSYNLADHVGDNPTHVSANRQRLRQQLQLPSEPIWLNQVHGCQVIDASTANAGATADASYSHLAGVVCAVMTADCLPLLLCSQDGTKIAAVHCGWRGLLAGIIAQTVMHLGKGPVLAWMGPAIGPKAFSVGPEVRQLLIDKSREYERTFVALSNNKWLADIYNMTRIELNAVGISQIFGTDRCTYNETDHFFSYRRQARTGRMATLIWQDP